MDFNTIFVWIFILMFAALGVSDFIEARKSPTFKGQAFFGLLFLVASVSLLLHKVKTP
jgi:hypothetical protein